MTPWSGRTGRSGPPAEPRSRARPASSSIAASTSPPPRPRCSAMRSASHAGQRSIER
ncbi:hypothetical protein ACFQV2_18135 [Actinokineospora soli]|uniref:Uncharacterized protein n=1 Tax=Actinokineospora soli TaxID=1048753 RepID=A0ABW2TMX5_9PSEU